MSHRDAEPHRRSGGSRSPIWLLVLLNCTCATEAMAAADSGQWWWDATVGYFQRNQQFQASSSQSTDTTNQELRAAFGLNGVIIHPAIARFNVDLNVRRADFNNGSNIDSDNVGFGAGLNLIPRGTIPVHLYYKRQLYDYSGPATQDPFTVLRQPDVGTYWGGRLRVMRSALRGLRFGFEGSELTFEDGNTPPSVYQQQSLNWSRSMRSFRHGVNFRRRVREGGFFDPGYDELRFTLEEQGRVSSTWDWWFYAEGIDTDFEFSDGRQNQAQDYRLNNRFTKRLGPRRFLDFVYSLNDSHRDSTFGFRRQRLQANYRWRPAEAWEVYAFGQYNLQTTGPTKIDAPRAGFSAQWSHSVGSFDSAFTWQGSLGLAKGRQSTTDMRERQFAWEIAGTLGHGSEHRLRKELEFGYGSDAFRMRQEPIDDIPDPDLPLIVSGSTENATVRGILKHSWDSSSINGWIQWRSNRLPDDLVVGAVQAETVSANLQGGIRRVNLTVNAGKATLRRQLSEDVRSSFASVQALWNVNRLLSLRSSYRADDRSLTLSPDLSGWRSELGMRFRLRIVDVEVEYSKSTEEFASGDERTARGLSLWVSSRFSGWLPIVTGTRVRGVIR